MPTVTGLATRFITFSRPGASGGGATVTDRDGKIKWAGHNLLLASESFDSSSWTKTTTTVSANSHAAPNSTTTAETLTASSANGTTLQSYTALAVSYTFGVWLKRKTGTGNIQIAADSGTYTTVTITSDWALYTVTQTPAAGTISAGIRIVTSGDEVYAWGAHLYRSDLGGMQQNPAMPAGMGSYYPTTPRNLVGFTESLTTGWTNTNTTDSIVTETNPNGLASSVEVTATSANGTLLGSLSLLASPYTFSIWLKRKTGSGTVEITVDGTTYVSAAVTSNWTRFSTTLTPSAGTKTPGIRLVTSGDAVYAWGAMLSDSASLDTYVPQYGAAVTSAAYYAPRLDFDGATLSPRGLLVEEQRANSLTYSSDFTNAIWNYNSFRTLQVTADQTTAPDGTQTADKAVEAAAGAGSVIHRVLVYDGSASAQKVFSVYAKKAERKRVYLIVNGPTAYGGWFDLDLGTCDAATDYPGGIASITLVGGGWYRCSLRPGAASSGDVVQICVIRDTATTFDTRVGDGASGVFIWGAQLEAGSFATSYIPTGAATATRTADVASVSVQAFPYSASTGSWVASVDFISTPASAARIIGTDGGALVAPLFASSSTQVGSWNGAVSLTASGGNLVTGAKAAVASDGTGRSLVIAGGTVATDANTFPAAGVAYLGSTGTTSFMSGHIRQITYIPRRLTNSELQSRTA